MPIKLWWWVEPLYETGFFTLIIGVVLAMLIDKVSGDTPIPAILSALSILPWLIRLGSVIVWFVTNMMILIWR